MESIAQICLLGVTNSMQIRQKIYSMQKKNQQKSFVKKSGNIKEDSFETIPRKKDHYNTTKGFLPLFHGL